MHTYREFTVDDSRSAFGQATRGCPTELQPPVTIRDPLGVKSEWRSHLFHRYRDARLECWPGGQEKSLAKDPCEAHVVGCGVGSRQIDRRDLLISCGSAG